jgi:hypothetical protein
MKFEGSKDIKALRSLTHELQQRYRAVGEEFPNHITQHMANLENEYPLGDKSSQVSHVLNQLARAEREIYTFK